MQQLDPMVFVSVFQEMLGIAFWPLVALILLVTLALLGTLIRDRGVDSRRLVLSQAIGMVGGAIAIGAMLWFTSSTLADLLGGPIDWLLTVGIGLAGTIGGAMTAYVALSLLLPRALHHAR